MSTGKVLISILVAATAGAAIGMLFAPKKGSTIRRKISNGGKRYFNEVMDKYNDVVEGVDDAIEEMKLRKEEMLANGSSKIVNKTKEVA